MRETLICSLNPTESFKYTDSFSNKTTIHKWAKEPLTQTIHSYTDSLKIQYLSTPLMLLLETFCLKMMIKFNSLYIELVYNILKGLQNMKYIIANVAYRKKKKKIINIILKILNENNVFKIVNNIILKKKKSVQNFVQQLKQTDKMFLTANWIN